MDFSIDIEGFDEVIRSIQKLEDKVKSKELKKIFVRQSQPILEQMRKQVPIATETIEYSRNRSIKIPPGNLRNSLKKFKGRSEEFPAVYVGPKVKKKTTSQEDAVIGSGWYGYFLNYGTTNGIKAQHFIRRTYSLVAASTGNRVTDKTLRYLEKLEREIGFEVYR